MTAITTEQMNDLMPFIQQYNQEKRDAAAQRQAEIGAAKETPNYETATKTRKPRKSAEPQPIITITRHSWNHISRVCYRSWASKPLSQRDELAYKKAVTADKPTEYEAKEYNGRLYRVYQTIIEDGKARCCSCPATKPCKHMKHYEQVEASRNQTSAREQALAAARAASADLVAQFDQEVQEQVEQELAAPSAPRSEMARLADLPLSEDEQRKIEQERNAARIAALNEEFPVGMNVPPFHGAGVMIEDGIVVEMVATNVEGIDYVVVEALESGERAGISCCDLRCLIREHAAESIDEEAKIQQSTAEELANAAPLNGNRRDGVLMPPPLNPSQTPMVFNGRSRFFPNM